jgi:hypothetical protein
MNNLQKIELLAPPIIALLALFIVSTNTILSMLVWFASLIPHELGHAYLYWLSGTCAIPSIGVTVTCSAEPSIIFSGFFLLIFGAGFYFAKTTHNRFWTMVCGFSICGFIAFLAIPSDTKLMLVIWGGQAGELVLSSVFIAMFHFRMPEFFSWQKNRYIFLIIGLVTLTNATLTWHKAIGDFEKLPRGAVFDFGKIFTGESGGDIDRLIRDFGWSEPMLANHYLWISWLCIISVVTNYLWHFWIENQTID